jgi:hypothetical protein
MIICKIEKYTGATFVGGDLNNVQIQDDIKVGDKLYIGPGHELVIDTVSFSGDLIIITSGELFLKLRKI